MHSVWQEGQTRRRDNAYINGDGAFHSNSGISARGAKRSRRAGRSLLLSQMSRHTAACGRQRAQESMPSVSLAVGWCAELCPVVIALATLNRLARDRIVTLVTFLSLGLRVLIGETLYWVSALRLPFLTKDQLPGGAW